MGTNSTSGLITVSIGVLLVVLSRVLSEDSPWRLAMSATGAVIAVIGVVLVARARRAD